jgi:hypothetical protein
MKGRKVLSLAGMLLILGAGLAFAQGPANRTQASGLQENGRLLRAQARILFVDENGDGICDFFRDHDQDGIPNKQDPDWSKDKAAGGERFQAGNKRAEGQFQFRMGLRNGSGLSHRSFRNQLGFSGAGGGVCGVPGGKGGQGNGGGKGKH